MRSVPPETPRTGLPSSGTMYTPTPPSAPRSLTAPSSSRSRDSVAWVTSMPSSASIAASSVWLCTDCEDRIEMMRACRPTRVAEVMPRLPLAPVLARTSLRSSLALVFGKSCLDSRSLQQPHQQRLLGVQPVLGLVPHRAARSVDDLVG